MCKFHILGACTRGEACAYAHSKEQLGPLPDLFRTKICRKLINTGCCNDPECRFAHSRTELRAACLPDGTHIPPEDGANEVFGPVPVGPVSRGTTGPALWLDGSKESVIFGGALMPLRAGEVGPHLVQMPLPPGQHKLPGCRGDRTDSDTSRFRCHSGSVQDNSVSTTDEGNDPSQSPCSGSQTSGACGGFGADSESGSNGQAVSVMQWLDDDEEDDLENSGDEENMLSAEVAKKMNVSTPIADLMSSGQVRVKNTFLVFETTDEPKVKGMKTVHTADGCLHKLAMHGLGA